MQVGQHATLSRDDHGLAEDLRAEDEGRPDVGPDRRVGGVTGVMSHVDLGPELSLLVLDAVCRGLKDRRNGGYLSLYGQCISTWDNRLQALFTHFRMNVCNWEHWRIEG